VSLTVKQLLPGPVWNPTIVKNHTVAEGSTLNLKPVDDTDRHGPEVQGELQADQFPP